jgi:hypothetical protein
MDSNILSTIAIIISILSAIIGIINHRKVKSKCFGHDIGESSIDITTTTPEQTNNLKIKLPESPK